MDLSGGVECGHVDHHSLILAAQRICHEAPSTTARRECPSRNRDHLSAVAYFFLFTRGATRSASRHRADFLDSQRTPTRSPKHVRSNGSPLWRMLDSVSDSF